MKHEDAVSLIRDAVDGHNGVWADLGAGSGTFTRALASILDDDSRIYAIDRDPQAVQALSRWGAAHAPRLVALTADLSRALDLAGLVGGPLDGILLANALHFMRDHDAVLARLAQSLGPDGRVVIVGTSSASHPSEPQPESATSRAATVVASQRSCTVSPSAGCAGRTA